MKYEEIMDFLSDLNHGQKDKYEKFLADKSEDYIREMDEFLGSIGERPLLFQAVDLDAARLLMSRGAKMKQFEGFTLLTNAVRMDNDLGKVQFFLEQGADINEQNRYEFTALSEAVQKDNIKIVKFLLERGADTEIKSYTGNTPLHFSVGNYEITKLLIEYGADVNAQDIDGFTPLHTCLDADVAKLLLESGADPFLKNNDHYSPFQFSIPYPKIKAVFETYMEKALEKVPGCALSFLPIHIGLYPHTASLRHPHPGGKG